MGRDLNEVVNLLGVWSLRWIGELGDQDLDPHLLFWDMRRTIPVDAWPRSRTVLSFRFTDQPRPTAAWWLVVAGEDVDVCDYDPGYAVTVDVETTLRTLVEIWRADTSWDRALRTGAVRLTGPEAARRAVPRWLGRMALADLAEAAP